MTVDERTRGRQPGAGTSLLGAVYRTRSGTEVLIRHCRGLAEFEACEWLQRQIWGYPDLEVTPRKSFMLAQELGGQAIAAFEPGGRMAGFVMAMAALEARPDEAKPQPFLHSHMLAVLPEYRNQGLGARLKLAQREDALGRGIVRMSWTFDPLAAKNAFLNLHRLGAIARRYSPDYYGVSSSRLQGGLPTDRLHADWWLRSARVENCLAKMIAPNERLDKELSTHSGKPSEKRSVAGSPYTILLPVEVEEWKQSEAGLEKVRAIQSGNRALFLDAFARGLAVTDFSRDAAGNGVFELTAQHPGELAPWGTAYED